MFLYTVNNVSLHCQQCSFTLSTVTLYTVNNVPLHSQQCSFTQSAMFLYTDALAVYLSDISQRYMYISYVYISAVYVYISAVHVYISAVYLSDNQDLKFICSSVG